MKPAYIAMGSGTKYAKVSVFATQDAAYVEVVHPNGFVEVVKHKQLTPLGGRRAAKRRQEERHQLVLLANQLSEE